MQELKKIRIDRGFSTVALASALGTTRATITRWEKGQRSPDMEMLRRLSNVLGCTIDELVGGGNPTAPPAPDRPGGKTA